VREERDDDLARHAGHRRKGRRSSYKGKKDRDGLTRTLARVSHGRKTGHTQHTHAGGRSARASASRERHPPGATPESARSFLSRCPSLSLSLSPTASFPAVAEYIPPGERHHAPRTVLAHMKRERVRARERGGGRRGRDSSSSSVVVLWREAPNSRRFGASEKNGSAAILVHGSRHLLCQLYQSVVVVRRRRRRRGAVSLSLSLSLSLAQNARTTVRPSGLESVYSACSVSGTAIKYLSPSRSRVP